MLSQALESETAATTSLLEGEKATHKQFEEGRALGRGAFGAVFLVFKKVCTPPSP